MENFIQDSFVPLDQSKFTSDEQRMKEEAFPFGVLDQSSFLQDFHHLGLFDHHDQHGSTSSNPLLDSSCINNGPFPDCSYQENMVEFYESKPHLVNHQLQATKDPHFTLDHHHQEISLVAEHDPMNMMRMVSFDYPPTEIIKPVNFTMQNDVSSSSSSSAWKGKKKPTSVKGQWTSEEDRILVQLVEKYGSRKWSYIAQVLPGRIGKQCRERWHNHLKPDIKKETWSEEEDRVLIELHKEIGNRWAEIAKSLPGRTENSIKNHWNATKRRQFSKRKSRSKYPRHSLLEDYIKSLNLGALSSSSVPARGRRKEKKDDVTVGDMKKEKVEEEICGEDMIVPEWVFADDFGFNEKLLEEGCSIDSLLDDIPQPDIDAFVRGI